MIRYSICFTTNPSSAPPYTGIALPCLHTGQVGTILRILGDGPLHRRLLDMGLTPGTRILLRNTAPSGDPIEIQLRGYALILRREDAGSVFVYPEEHL